METLVSDIWYKKFPFKTPTLIVGVFLSCFDRSRISRQSFNIQRYLGELTKKIKKHRTSDGVGTIFALYI